MEVSACASALAEDCGCLGRGVASSFCAAYPTRPCCSRVPVELFGKVSSLSLCLAETLEDESDHV